MAAVHDRHSCLPYGVQNLDIKGGTFFKFLPKSLKIVTASYNLLYYTNYSPLKSVSLVGNVLLTREKKIIGLGCIFFLLYQSQYQFEMSVGRYLGRYINLL